MTTTLTYRDNAKIVLAKKRRSPWRFSRLKAFIRRTWFRIKAKPCGYAHCLYGHSLTTNIYQPMVTIEKIYVHSECLAHSKKARLDAAAREQKRLNEIKRENAIQNEMRQLDLKKEAYERWIAEKAFLKQRAEETKHEKDYNFSYPKIMDNPNKPHIGPKWIDNPLEEHIFNMEMIEEEMEYCTKEIDKRVKNGRYGL